MCQWAGQLMAYVMETFDDEVGPWVVMARAVDGHGFCEETCPMASAIVNVVEWWAIIVPNCWIGLLGCTVTVDHLI